MPNDHIPHPETDPHDTPATPPDADPETVVIYMRIPRALLARVDAHASDLSRRASGADVTRAAAIRALLDRALSKGRAA